MTTYSKSQLSKMSFTALNYAKNADTNGNGYVSRTEATVPQNHRTPTQLKRFAQFHDEALHALKRKTSLTPGQLYAYSKTLLDEMRAVMDSKGNKDHKLQPAELKYLSSGAKLLLKFYDSLATPNGKRVRETLQPQLPTPARPNKPKPLP